MLRIYKFATIYMESITMSSGRPSIFRRKYVINKSLQMRITLAMVIEVALITASLSLILVHINQYYLGLITYFVGPAEAEQIALSDINKGIWYFLIGGVTLSSVVFAMIGIFISHKVAGPLYRLKRYMQYIRNGEYSNEIRFRTGDQLHDMADTFNEMAMSLEMRKEIDILYLERMEATLKKLLSTPPAATAKTAEQLTRLQQIVTEMKENKTYIYNEPVDPKQGKKLHKLLKQHGNKVAAGTA